VIFSTTLGIAMVYQSRVNKFLPSLSLSLAKRVVSVGYKQNNGQQSSFKEAFQDRQKTNKPKEMRFIRLYLAEIGPKTGQNTSNTPSQVKHQWKLHRFGQST